VESEVIVPNRNTGDILVLDLKTRPGTIFNPTYGYNNSTYGVPSVVASIRSDDDDGNDGSNDSSGLSVGAIVGIVIGGIVVLLGASALALYFCSQQQKGTTRMLPLPNPVNELPAHPQPKGTAALTNQSGSVMLEEVKASFSNS